jgi:hypothetical protein
MSRARLAPLATLLLTLVGAPALAQDAPSYGDTVWAKARTPSTRFPDAEDAGPVFEKGAELIVLVVEADEGRLRVMQRDQGPLGADTVFGWIPSDTITTDRPGGDDARLQEALKNLDLSGFDLSPGGAGGSPGGMAPPGGGAPPATPGAE